VWLSAKTICGPPGVVAPTTRTPAKIHSHANAGGFIGLATVKIRGEKVVVER
jgi:hypothetical protein